MNRNDPIPPAWAMKIATVLKDNFTMADILSLTNAFAANQFALEVKYAVAPEFMNKQNVAQQNLSSFSVGETIQFLSEIVDSGTGYSPEQLEKLYQEIVKKFPEIANVVVESYQKSEKIIADRFSNYADVM